MIQKIQAVEESGTSLVKVQGQNPLSQLNAPDNQAEIRKKNDTKVKEEKEEPNFWKMLKGLFDNILVGFLMLLLHPILVHMENIGEKLFSLLCQQNQCTCEITIPANTTISGNTLGCTCTIEQTKIHNAIIIIGILISSIALIVIIINSIAFPLCKFNVLCLLYQWENYTKKKLKIAETLKKKTKIYKTYKLALMNEINITELEKSNFNVNKK